MEALLENCRILFRNFSGRKTEMNDEGKRNFCVVLTEDQAEEMSRDGWNVKLLRPRNEDDLPAPYIKVKVNFAGFPKPTLVLISSKGRTPLSEDLAQLLDYADIANVDLIIRPFHYDYRGRKGRTAYLKSIYVTIREDALERKYSDLPLAPMDGAANPHAIEAGPSWDYEGEEVMEIER